AISVVSRDLSAPVRRLVPRARAASSNARLVIDLLPGGVIRPMSGCVGGVMASGGEDMVTPVAYACRQRKQSLLLAGRDRGGGPIHGVGHFKGEGKPDIVLPNVGGTTVLWEMGRRHQ